jgi:hypothetical protein
VLLEYFNGNARFRDFDAFFGPYAIGPAHFALAR